MKRRSRSGCLIVFAILLLAVAGIWLYMQFGPFQRAEVVSPEIADITGKSDLILERLRKIDTPIGRVTEYRIELDNQGSIYFQVDDNKNVVSYFRTGKHTQLIRIQMEQAIEIAREFAREHYPDQNLIDEKPNTAELVNLQEDNRYYDICWTKRDKLSGASLPQSAWVQVNAQSGEVIGYQRVYVAELPAVASKLTNEEAKSKAIQLIQPYINQPEAAEEELVVMRVPINSANGSYKTVWQLKIYGKSDLNGDQVVMTVFIDAMTGEMIQAVPIP